MNQMQQMNQTMQAFSQLLMMPVAMMETFMRGMQSASGSAASCQVSLPPASCEPCALPETRDARSCCREGCRCDGKQCHDGCPCRRRCRSTSCCGDSCRCDGTTCREGCPCWERRHCGSDKVKLIEYSLVQLHKYGDGRILKAGQILVSECTDMCEVHNEIIVDYVREHKDVNGKNLRVYTCMLDCWCKPEFDWQEEQIKALDEIRHAIAKKN
ncbi:MAG: hypothetical protein D6696_04330 [Acidobacteria bacterium]|nr:MAG: hypothetical protein D6696_04330 [Acidobacteriota bacterium]